MKVPQSAAAANPQSATSITEGRPLATSSSVTPIVQQPIENNAKIPAWWTMPFREIGNIARAFWGQNRRVVQHLADKIKQRSLDVSAQQAQLAFARALCEARIGDVSTLDEIAALNSKIQILREGKGSTSGPEHERTRLLRGLADEALRKPCPRGLEDVYDRAQSASIALREQAATTQQSGKKLLPACWTERVRVLAGFAVVVCLLCAPIFLVARNPSPPPQPLRGNELIATKRAPVEAPLPPQGTVADLPVNKDTLIRTAEGIGATYDEALKDAFRKAIWQVVGVVVDAETIMKDDTIASDQVLTYANGTIKTFEEVSKLKDQDLFRVKIRAAVEKRRVFDNLKAYRVTEAAVKGSDLYGEIVTQMERAKNARALVARCLKGFPLNVMNAEIVGKPEVADQVGDRAKIRLRCHIRVSPQAYLRFVAHLMNTLEIVAKNKGTEIGFYRSSFGTLTESGQPHAVDVRHHCEDFVRKAGKDVYVLINVHRTQDNGRTEWTSYTLDNAVRPVLAQCCRNLQLKFTLLSESSELIAVQRMPAILHGNQSGWDYAVPTNAILGFHGAFVISPFYYMANTNGLYYWDGRNMEMTFDLALDEIRRIRDIRCELSQD